MSTFLYPGIFPGCFQHFHANSAFFVTFSCQFSFFSFSSFGICFPVASIPTFSCQFSFFFFFFLANSSFFFFAARSPKMWTEPRFGLFFFFVADSPKMWIEPRFGLQFSVYGSSELNTFPENVVIFLLKSSYTICWKWATKIFVGIRMKYCIRVRSKMGTQMKK